MYEVESIGKQATEPYC